jgi:hypothetical protein
MKLNVSHPTFVTFLENINTSILTNIKIDNYFTITKEKKFGIQYMVLKLVRNAVNVKAKLSASDLKNFVGILQTKNEETENYEFAAVLKDIVTDFDAVNNFTKTPRKSKIIKVDKQENGE